MTSGGSEAIFSIYAALMKPGDHMVCETPNYPSNYGIPQGLGQDVTLCSMDFEDDYRLNLDKIKSMVQPNTKVLSICHPNNPTGCCITVEELQNLVDFCREKDIYLLSDETYREMYLEDPPPAACTLYDKAISITSMSKCYGIPGCRIGWLACKDQHLLDEVLTVREYVSITNNSVGEVLATEVLKRGEEMMAEHRGFSLQASCFESPRRQRRQRRGTQNRRSPFTCPQGPWFPFHGRISCTVYCLSTSLGSSPSC